MEQGVSQAACARPQHARNEMPLCSELSTKTSGLSWQAMTSMVTAKRLNLDGATIRRGDFGVAMPNTVKTPN